MLAGNSHYGMIRTGVLNGDLFHLRALIKINRASSFISGDGRFVAAAGANIVAI